MYPGIVSETAPSIEQAKHQPDQKNSEPKFFDNMLLEKPRRLPYMHSTIPGLMVMVLFFPD
jgi:hypothetical protein